MPAPQSYKNHTMIDPLHHLIITPLTLLNLAFSGVIYAHHHRAHPHLTAWWIVVSILIVLIAAKSRYYALRLQDRLIRLEERLRLTALLPSAEHSSISALSTGQLIALRFASDRELPALSRRALAENLAPKQIKQAIQDWRPDDQRV